MKDEDLEVWMERFTSEKAARRRDLARLPFEEKVRIIVKLQQIAYDLRAHSGRPAPEPWKISE